MKITCPKCHSAYRVDLPDPGEAGIDVQCGNCHHIFLFIPHLEKPSSSGIQGDASEKTRESNLQENFLPGTVPPPQMDHDEDQETADSQSQAFSSPETDPEIPQDLERGSYPIDPGPLEIVIENDPPDDSLEKEALDHIWDEVVQEGARTVGKSKEKSPDTPSKKPVADSAGKETPEKTPLSHEKKTKPLPSLQDRQREIDQIIADHRAKQEESEDKTSTEKSQPPPSQKDQQQHKTQEEIDLEEQVTVNEEETTISWEEAFADQTAVEDGWKKAKEQDRIQEEQQLAEALGKKTIPPVPAKEESPTKNPQEDKQSLVDEIFAEAKALQEKTQEDIDLEEHVEIREDEPLPSWEDAFSHQSEVETGWRNAQAKDRIHEEQQLADALGEDYLPSSPSTEETLASAGQENKQDLVDQLFEDANSQQEITEPPEDEIPEESQEVTGEKDPDPKDTDAVPHTIPGEIDLMNDLDDLDMKELVTKAFKEESESQEKTQLITPETPTIEDEVTQELELSMESTTEAPQESQPPPEEALPDLEMESIQELTLESEEEPEPLETTSQEDIEIEPLETLAQEEPEPREYTEPSIPDTTPVEDAGGQETELILESAIEADDEAQPPPEKEPLPDLDMESVQELTLESEEEPEPLETTAQEEIEIEPEPAEIVDQEEAFEIEPELEMETAPESAENLEAIETAVTETSSELESEPEPATMEHSEPPIVTQADSYKNQDSGVDDDDLDTWADLLPEPQEEAPAMAIDESMSETGEEEPALVEEPSITMTSPEPEPAAVEYSEPPIVTQADSDKGQDSRMDEDDLEGWTDLLPEPQEEAPDVAAEASMAETGGEEEPTPSDEPSVALTSEEGPPVTEEAPMALDGEEESFGGDDFWDQVLEKEPQESPSGEIEIEPEPVASAPVAENMTETEPLTDDELWQQAFPGEEELEPAASIPSGEDSEDSQPSVPSLIIGASVNLDEEPKDSLDFDEAAFADDDDDDEFEFQRRKRKLGPFTIPQGRRGDLVLTGAFMVFLLIAGSVYFTLQTFAPGELTDMETAQTEVPEGLTPREVPLDELTGDLTSPKPEKTPAVDTPGDQGEAILSDPAKILEESPEEKGILKDLAESQILKDTGKSQTAKIDQSGLQALTGHSVTLSTIMPVAYNPTDIRVLSFSVEIQLSNAQSAKRVRESLPVYEEIMNQTVEDFLRRKFYNDVLYVKEKLQKRLQTVMNKSIKNGRVRKTKFTDFAIQ